MSERSSSPDRTPNRPAVAAKTFLNSWSQRIQTVGFMANTLIFGDFAMKLFSEGNNAGGTIAAIGAGVSAVAFAIKAGEGIASVFR